MALNLNRQKSQKSNVLIPTSLTHSSGTITAIFSGKIYQTVLSGLSVNTRYQLYIVPGGSLIYSTNENSVGPAGYTSWFLVGSFYAGSTTSVGGFIRDIYGNPSTEWMDYTPTWTVSSGTNPSIGNGSILGRKFRDADRQNIEIYINSGTSTTYGSGVYLFGLPSTEPAVISAPSGLGSITMYRNTAPFNSYVGLVNTFSSTQLLASGSGISNWSNTAPVTLDAATAGHSIKVIFSYKVVGWSSTPIAYL